MIGALAAGSLVAAVVLVAAVAQSWSPAPAPGVDAAGNPFGTSAELDSMAVRLRPQVAHRPDGGSAKGRVALLAGVLVAAIAVAPAVGWGQHRTSEPGSAKLRRAHSWSLRGPPRAPLA